jgi:hypothetical protein
VLENEEEEEDHACEAIMAGPGDRRKRLILKRRSTILRNITEEKRALEMGGVAYLISNEKDGPTRKSTYMDRLSKFGEIFGQCLQLKSQIKKRPVAGNLSMKRSDSK